jgi:hypothetical protein
VSGRGLALAVLIFCAALPAAAQDPPAGDEQTALVDALLTGLLGFHEISPSELQDEVARVGGVPFRSPVPLGYMTSAEFVVYLKGVLDEEYPPAKARADERMLIAFDLLPPDTDLRQLRTKLLEQNVAGFYDDRPGRKRLYSVSGQPRLTPSNQLVLSHELRHALQDQYVDLHAALPANLGDFDDRRFALLSLLEGDATLVMQRFLQSKVPGLEAGGGQGLGALASGLPLMGDVPAVLRDQLLLPYVAGHDFVLSLFERGGWEAVRRAWTLPPASTEQVLHPEKYVSSEPPRPVPPAAPPAGGTLLAEGVLGEVLANTLLGNVPAAAAGWGGDRYEVWDVGGRTLLCWRSVWDTDADRREFAEALRARFERTHGARRTLQGAALFAKGRWNTALLEDGEGVTFLSSDDVSLLTAALKARPPAGR